MRLFVCAAIISLAAACSSVQPLPNHRVGLLDHLKDLEPANGGAKLVSASESKGELHNMQFRWPLDQVRVTSPFGKRGHEFHEGVDLHAEAGTPVFAAYGGRVIYAGHKIRGYGNLVVIRHPSGVSTVYAHNSKILVRKGQSVRMGDRIAISGKTGRVTGPHLHFEIRDGISAVDPLKVMPSQAAREIARSDRSGE